MNKKQKILFSRVFLAGALVSLILGCSTTPNNAPVVDRADAGRLDGGKPAYGTNGMPVKPAGDGKINYVVKKGDTLYRIAMENGQSYGDLVVWNNLRNANDIKVDQVLRVAPPDANLNGAAQTMSVTSGSGIEVRSLAPGNSMVNKSGPRGDKQAYSEANLAELQKPDGPSGSVSGVAVKQEPAAVRPNEKISTPTLADQDNVDWIWPTEGKVIAGFDDAKNKGLDISGKLGQDVLAAGAGKVMYEGSGIRGYGNLVIIKHTNNLLSAYAHNKSNLVKEGQIIVRGQKIAEMGNSDSDAIKLHFEIRQQGKPVDPSKFLPVR
jgi:lipoprotein NlpD